MMMRRVRSVFRALYGEIPAEEMRRVAALSMILFSIIGGFWLLDSLKDPIFSSLVGLEWQPLGKMLSMIFTLGVVFLYNFAIDYWDNIDRAGNKHRMFYLVGAVYGPVFLLLGFMLASKSYGLRSAHQMSGAAGGSSLPAQMLGWGTYFAIESYGSVAVALFWAYTNASVSLEWAKSAYGLIIAGAQVGAFMGSSTATLSETFHVSTLFMAGGLTPFLVMFLVNIYATLFLDEDGMQRGAEPREDGSTRRAGHSNGHVHHNGSHLPHGAKPVAAANPGARTPTKTATSVGASTPPPETRMQVIEDGAGGDGDAGEGGGSTVVKTFWDGLMLVLRYPYVTGLLGISCLYEVVLTVLDFDMKVIGRSRYDDTPRGAEQFARLMGNFGQATNLVSFCVALLGTSIIVRKLGVRSALLVYPVLLVAGVVLSFLFPSLWVFLVAMSLLKGMTYALNEPIKEMLYMPTSDEIKYKAKAWIDVFGSRFAKAVGSAINTRTARHSMDSVAKYGGVPSLLTAAGLLMLAFWMGMKFDILASTGETVGTGSHADEWIMTGAVEDRELEVPGKGRARETELVPLLEDSEEELESDDDDTLPPNSGKPPDVRDKNRDDDDADGRIENEDDADEVMSV